MPASFQNWYANNLLVHRFPVPTEIARKYVPAGVRHVLNVSDEHIPSVAQACAAAQVPYYWFPLGEGHSDMGLSSLFGALVILHDAAAAGEGVLLHCHAGANRSPTVAQAFYFMQTGQHWGYPPYTAEQRDINQWIDPGCTDERRQNAVLSNIEMGRLPARDKLEAFLQELKRQLLANGYANRGGVFTHCQIYAEL